jgi:hypothetical protein
MKDKQLESVSSEGYTTYTFAERGKGLNQSLIFADMVSCTRDAIKRAAEWGDQKQWSAFYISKERKVKITVELVKD